MNITLALNGLNTTIDIQPHEYLLDVLRRNGCLGVKRGCDTGSCGVCTVLMDDQPVLSCTLLAAKAHGHRITTIEGIQNEMGELAKAMTEEGAEQCGYCSPGLAIMILWLKKNHPHATEEEIKHLLIGNLCRCSGYAGQLRGIQKYLGVK